jgi:hypothetical protein
VFPSSEGEHVRGAEQGGIPVKTTEISDPETGDVTMFTASHCGADRRSAVALEDRTTRTLAGQTGA